MTQMLLYSTFIRQVVSCDNNFFIFCVQKSEKESDMLELNKFGCVVSSAGGNIGYVANGCN